MAAQQGPVLEATRASPATVARRVLQEAEASAATRAPAESAVTRARAATLVAAESAARAATVVAAESAARAATVAAAALRGTGGNGGSGGVSGAGGNGGASGMGGNGGPDNLCPKFFVLNAIPSNIPSGQSTTDVEVRADDPDDGPLPLLTTLYALSGSFGDVHAPETVYTCADPGLIEICADASDGACVKTLCIDVRCPEID